MATTILSWLLATLAVAGIAYTLIAARLVAGFLRGPAAPPAPPEPATLLKPLHGAEPGLAENLASFLDQAWDAPVQMVCGVQRAADPARAALRGLDAGPRRRVVEVVDATRHGANGKVSNLLNMSGTIAHDLILLSDSDMVAPRDYLARLAAVLAVPGVGAATCAYVGRGVAGGWSRLAAGGIGYGFLPLLLLGLRLGLARPGMGSTIALRRATLDAVGGFVPFADSLADDYDLCAAIRATGLATVVPPMLLVHACAEASLAELWRHERRWAATVRTVDPAGFAGTVVTQPVPFALALLAFQPLPGAMLLAGALAARLLLKRAVDRAAGFAAMPAWWLPLRDCLGLAVFVSAFVARSVDWRGATLTMKPRGRIAAPPQVRPESDTR